MFKNKKVELVNYLKIRYDEKVKHTEHLEVHTTQQSTCCSVLRGEMD